MTHKKMIQIIFAGMMCAVLSSCNNSTEAEATQAHIIKTDSIGALNFRIDEDDIDMIRNDGEGFLSVSLYDKDSQGAATVVWIKDFAPEKPITTLNEAIGYYDSEENSGSWQESKCSYFEEYEIYDNGEATMVMYLLPKDYNVEGMYMITVPYADGDFPLKSYKVIKDALTEYDMEIETPDETSARSNLSILWEQGTNAITDMISNQ